MAELYGSKRTAERATLTPIKPLKRPVRPDRPDEEEHGHPEERRPQLARPSPHR